MDDQWGKIWDISFANIMFWKSLTMLQKLKEEILKAKVDLASGRVSCNLVWALEKWWMRLESFLTRFWMKKFKCEQGSRSSGCPSSRAAACAAVWGSCQQGLTSWAEPRLLLGCHSQGIQHPGNRNTHSSVQEVHLEVEFCISPWVNPNSFLLRKGITGDCSATLSAVSFFWRVSCQSLFQF